MNTTDYDRHAHLYALRDISGTDALAFREVARRGPLHDLDVLDFGCGAGRSTRFLRRLHNNVTGVDASAAMVEAARRLDPSGDYRLVARGAPLPFPDGTFGGAFASWVLVEEGDASRLQATFNELARVLRPGGRMVVVANTREFYSGVWATCEVNFPENLPPLRSGQRVRARLLPQGVDVHDYFWSDDDYARFARDAGLRIVHSMRPLADEFDRRSHWFDERRVAPYVVHVMRK